MHASQEQVPTPYRDPVCGRELTTAQTRLRVELKGQTYAFCSEPCLALFSIRPVWFFGRRNVPARRAS